MAAPKRKQTKKNKTSFMRYLYLLSKTVCKRNISSQNFLKIKPYVYLSHILLRLKRDEILYLYHKYPFLSFRNKKITRNHRVISDNINVLRKKYKYKKLKKYSHYNYIHYNTFLPNIINPKYSSLIGHHQFSLYKDVFDIDVLFLC